MSLTFYFAPMSTAELTRAVLAELGAAHDRVNLSIAARDTTRAEFLEINPNGRVPVIVQDGVAIWESAAITMYLGEQFGVEAGLYPPPGPHRGEAMAWIVWSNVSLAEAAGRLAAALPPGSEGAVEANSQDWVPVDERRAEKMAAAQTDLARWLRVLEGAVAARPFLLGAYSLVDTHLHSLVDWIGSMPVDRAPFPNIVAWMARCDERPALAARMTG